jgi:antitoxin (DNA-binding transcriptional repressor) of toxin-antitoxin stability system
MNMLAIESHPELVPLLRSLHSDGGVVITDHGRPVAFLGAACPAKPPDMFAFRRQFTSPPSSTSEMSAVSRRFGPGTVLCT